MSQLHSIRYTGELVAGHELTTVQARFAQAFRLAADKTLPVFRGGPVLLKRNLSPEQAARMHRMLEALGMRVLVEPPLAPSATAAQAAPPPARTVAGEQEQAREAPRPLPFEFHGQGREFFRIWIVNLLLTILTLGIYSAWAKVRTQRYFYGNTRLHDAAFDYLARPIDILKGRAIAVGLFLAYSVASELNPIAGLAMTLLFMAVMPWLIVRSLMFRARNTAWRNVRFGFDGSTKGAAAAFIGWPALGALTFGLLYPLALFKQNRFLVDHSRFGTSPFQFHARANDYFRTVLTIGLIMSLGLGLSLALTLLSPPLSPVAVALVYLVAFAWLKVSLTNLRFNNTTLGLEGEEHRFESSWALRSWLPVVLGNTLGIIFTLGLFYPWARVRSARYAAEHTRLLPAGELDSFVAAEQKASSALGEEVGEFFDVEFGL